MRQGPYRWLVSALDTGSPDLNLYTSLYSLGEGITLASAVQRIGSARRRDGGLQALHILLHFPQCKTELFDRAMAQSMDTVPHPEPKAFSGR